MAEGVELMLLVAVVFVWSGLTVCYGRSSEAIAHTVERQRDPVLRQKDVKAAEAGLPCVQRPLCPKEELHRPEPSNRWNNRDCFLF